MSRRSSARSRITNHSLDLLGTLSLLKVLSLSKRLEVLSLSNRSNGHRAGYDGYKRKKGSKVHAAVDTLGHLLALKVTAANEQERAQVADLAQEVQEATDKSGILAGSALDT